MHCKVPFLYIREREYKEPKSTFFDLRTAYITHERLSKRGGGGKITKVCITQFSDGKYHLSKDTKQMNNT